MKKSLLLVAAMIFGVATMSAQETDVNFALSSNGSSAEASSGNAAAAIDDNVGTRWESASEDPQTWTLNMGQARTFNTIQIVWEGAYGKTFTISTSDDGTTWSDIVPIEGQTLAGFPYTQTLTLDEDVTAQYVQFVGTERGTIYGYSFWEFRVFKAGEPELTTFSVTPAINAAKINEGVELSIVAKDQNDSPMANIDIEYSFSPEGAGKVEDGKYIPLLSGMAEITAKSADKESTFKVFGYAGDNLVLGKTVVADNGHIGNDDASKAIDGNEGSLWLAHEGVDPWGTDTNAWFVVDLGALYTVEMVYTSFEGASSQAYHIDFSVDNEVWDDSVYVYSRAQSDVLALKEFHFDNPAESKKVRFVRFWSTKDATGYGMKLYELQVFGYDYVNTDDTEKPVVTVDEEKTELTENSVKIFATATDNDEVRQLRVKNEALDLDILFDYVDVEEGILLSGLQLRPSAEYVFEVTAIDFGKNESEIVEVKIQTEHAALPNSAIMPTYDTDLVQTVYTDAYDVTIGSNLDILSTGYLAVNLAAADEALYFYNINDFSFLFEEPTDLSEMENLHVDIFSPFAATVKVVLVIEGNDYEKAISLLTNAWTRTDIQLSEFAGADLTKVEAIRFEAFEPEGTVVFVDNVLFWKAPVVPEPEPNGLQIVNAQRAEVKKMVVDGQVVIVREGKRFNLLGAEMK